MQSLFNNFIYCYDSPVYMEKVSTQLVKNIKAHFQKTGFTKAVIGLSGGIDSAVSAVVVAKAIGKEHVTAILMPEKGLSLKQNVMDAASLCRKFGIKYEIVPINPFVNAGVLLPWKASKLASMNTKSRIRAVILYNYANTHDALVVGTSNKSEILLGYFTKYGDGAVDFEAIGSLYKTEVVALGRYVGIPASILQKKPTAELDVGQTDEGELGAGYEEIDEILKAMEKRKPLVSYNAFLVHAIEERMKKNKHKLSVPPTIRI